MFQMPSRQQLAILILAAVIIFGSGYRYALWHWRANAESQVKVEQAAPSSGATATREILVHVAGAVEKPGVYHLPAGSRVQDAVKTAGALPDANLDALNLAAPVSDGQKIVVPSKQAGLGQGVPAPLSQPSANPFQKPGTASGNTPLVNINTASQKELESLPGIGPSLAQRIIQYRQEKGLFKTPEDIKNVSGIGEKKYEQIKDYITVY